MSFENRITKIEQSMEQLAKDVAVMATSFSTLKDNVEKITEVLIKQASYEQQAIRNAKDINHLANEIRRVDTQGTAVCPVHQLETKKLEENFKNLIAELNKSIEKRDKIFMTILTLIIAALITKFFNLI